MHHALALRIRGTGESRKVDGGRRADIAGRGAVEQRRNGCQSDRYAEQRLLLVTVCILVYYVLQRWAIEGISAVEKGTAGMCKPPSRRVFSMSGMWSDVRLGIVKERSSKWARMSDDRSRRARTLDRPHRVNPDAWSNYRGTTHSVAKP